MLTIQAWLQSHSNNPTQTKPNIRELSVLLEHLLQRNRAWLISHDDYTLSKHQITQLNDWVEQLSSGLPLAYITGKQAFWDFNLTVNRHTLIPRPDTEILIETAEELLTNNHPKSILDLGTGSGALALVLAKIYPDAEVLAVDQSDQALDAAKENANAHHLTHVEFLCSDWFSAITGKKFDLIISNPPYIAADDSHLTALKHEPIKALVADQAGMGDYIRICRSVKDYMTEGGLLIFEHGWQQQQQVHQLLVKSGLQNCASRKDLAGHVRVTFGYK